MKRLVAIGVLVQVLSGCGRGAEERDLGASGLTAHVVVPLGAEVVPTRSLHGVAIVDADGGWQLQVQPPARPAYREAAEWKRHLARTWLEEQSDADGWLLLTRDPNGLYHVTAYRREVELLCGDQGGLRRGQLDAVAAVCRSIRAFR